MAGHEVAGLGATQRIVDRLVPEFKSHQAEKARSYQVSIPGFPVGFENADVLGIPGQFSEIWRKVMKLKRGMWDREELSGEPLREVLLDMIGHCFLAIDMIDREAGAQFFRDGADLIRDEEWRRFGHGYDGCPVCISAGRSPNV